MGKKREVKGKEGKRRDVKGGQGKRKKGNEREVK